VLLSCAAAGCAAGVSDHPYSDAPPGGDTFDAPVGGGTDDAPTGGGTVDAPPPGLPDGPPGPITGDPDTCGKAIDLTGPAHSATGVDATGNTGNDYDNVAVTGCGLDPQNGPDAIYKITLAKGETASVTLTPDHWDPSLALTTECSSAAHCAVGTDKDGNGPETLTYTATDAGTFDIVVDGYSGWYWGSYTLHVEIR
jgi:hypothetical protein